MHCRYRCAIVLVVLFVALQIPGCGGNSATPALTVGTSSLPDGIVGISYSANLNAAGGTSPYTWSQTSGGDMPAGVTLGSAGVFHGTPQTAGTFGPYIFKVTDSTGATAASPSLSIKITGAQLTVTTTSLPAGTVGTAYSVALAASGGTPPYTWTETSGGALPPGLTDITSGGVLSGTPTTAGSYGPYVFTVTDSINGSAASQSLTLTISGSAAECAPRGNETALTAASPYAFLVKGTDGSGNPIDIAGSFTPDGAGGITSAAVDYNGFTNGPQSVQVDLAKSSYAFGSAARGCLYLSFSGLAATAVAAKPAGLASTFRPTGTGRVRHAKSSALEPVLLPTGVQFNFGLSGFDGTTYHTGRIIESDNTAGAGTNASGFIHVQVPSAFALTAFQPSYALGVDGWTASSGGLLRTAMAGSFSNNSGTLSAGYADLNAGGTPSGELTGGYGLLNGTIDPTTGRGTGTYFTMTPTGNLTFDFAFYVLNGSDLILLSTDLATDSVSSPLLSGRALASNASTGATLSGYYLLASQGLDVSGSTPGNVAEIGTLSATSTGTIPTARIYANDAGTYTSTPYPNSSFAVEAASGRLSFTGLTSAPPVAYLTAGATTDDGIAGFLVGTDTGASSGTLVIQSVTAPNYTQSSVFGSYAASTGEDVDGLNGAYLGAFTFDGTGGYVVTPLVTGSVPNTPRIGSIRVNGDGSGSLDAGNFPLVTNGDTLFAIPVSGDPLLFIFNAVAPPTP